jgi:hypothetical protein
MAKPFSFESPPPSHLSPPTPYTPPPLSSTQLVRAGAAVVTRALYVSADTTAQEAAKAALPSSLDPRLAQLCVQVLAASLAGWREAAVDQRVSLPRLEATSWRVDVVNATSDVAVTNEPVATLTLVVRDQPGGSGMQATHALPVALDAASLGALVDGMRRIKDQLATL